MSALIDDTPKLQPPVTGPSVTSSFMRPSRPTTRSTRTSSCVSASVRLTSALKARAMSPSMPASGGAGTRTEKSPSAAARRHIRSCW